MCAPRDPPLGAVESGPRHPPPTRGEGARREAMSPAAERDARRYKGRITPHAAHRGLCAGRSAVAMLAALIRSMFEAKQ
jgi:hypothetical protein